jgi:hypothetical protein
VTLNGSAGRLSLAAPAQPTSAAADRPGSLGYGGSTPGRSIAASRLAARNEGPAARNRERVESRWSSSSSSNSRSGSQLVATSTGQRRGGPGGTWGGNPATASSVGGSRDGQAEQRPARNPRANNGNRNPRQPGNGGSAPGQPTAPGGSEHTVTVGELVTGVAGTGAGGLGTSLDMPGGGTPMASSPEPSSLLLIGSGMAAVAAIRRRRRA